MNTKKNLSEKDLHGVEHRLEALKRQPHRSHRETEEKLLDNYDFIKLFQISLRTSKNWRDTGRIPYSRVGRKIYFKPSDIERMLDQNRNDKNHP